MSRSLIDIDTPFEPLPLYRRDPETSSILSSAPSYVSEAPTYYSQRPAPPSDQGSEIDVPSPVNESRARYAGSTPTPLITTANENATLTIQRPAAPQYAPGFTPRPEGPQALFDVGSYHVRSFSNFNANRQLHAVATRRARQAALTSHRPTSLRFTARPPSSSGRPSGTAGTRSPRTTASPEPSPYFATSHTSPASPSPLPLVNCRDAASPYEDPDLVGEAAASRARASRQYREACSACAPSSSTASVGSAMEATPSNSSRPSRGEERASSLREHGAFRAENKAWEFLVREMSDWGERERGWSRFRHRVAGSMRGVTAGAGHSGESPRARADRQEGRARGGGEVGGPSGSSRGAGEVGGSRAVVTRPMPPFFIASAGASVNPRGFGAFGVGAGMGGKLSGLREWGSRM